MFFIQKFAKYSYIYTLTNKLKFLSLFFYFSVKFPVIPVVTNHCSKLTKFIWKKCTKNNVKLSKTLAPFPAHFLLLFPGSINTYLNFFVKNYSNHNPISFNLNIFLPITKTKHNTLLMYFWSTLKTQTLVRRYLFNLLYWVTHSSPSLFFFYKKNLYVLNRPTLSYNLRYNYTFNILNLNNKLV